MSTTFYFPDGTSVAVGGGSGSGNIETVDYLPTFVNSIYNGSEGFYGVTGSVSGMSTAAIQYRWRQLTDGVVYRIHGPIWIMAEDQSLVSYHSKPAENKDIYIVGGTNSRYVQFASSSLTLEAVGKTRIQSIEGYSVDDIPSKYNNRSAQGKIVAFFGDSITSGSTDNGAFERYIPDICGASAINFGSSGASSKRVCGILTGHGEGDYADISSYYTAGLLDTVFIMTGINDGGFSTDSQIPSNVVCATGSTPIEDLKAGTEITVDGTAVSTLDDYYARFGTSMCGQLAFMIEWLQAKYPDVRILLGNYHLITQTVRKERLPGVDTVLSYISDVYGVQVADIRHTSGINESNAGKYLADGLHPNELGNKLVAEAISRYLC